MFSRKESVILVRFQHKLTFLENFSKKFQILYFKRMRLVKAELFYTEGQTGMTKLTVPFRNFAKVPMKTFVQQVPSS